MKIFQGNFSKRDPQFLIRETQFAFHDIIEETRVESSDPTGLSVGFGFDGAAAKKSAQIGR